MPRTAERPTTRRINSSIRLDRVSIGPIEGAFKIKPFERAETTPDEPWMLYGTGWIMWMEWEAFKTNLQANEKAGMNKEKAVTLAAKERAENMLSFLYEYLMQKAIWRLPYEFSEDGTHLRQEKSKVPILKATGKDERDGGTWDGFKMAQEQLAEARTGSIIVIPSPDGPSGIIDTKTGREIVHKGAQLYVGQKTEKGFMGFTLATRMTLEENINLMEKLGQPNPELAKASTFRDRLRSVVSNPALLAPLNDEEPPSLKAVIYKVREVMNSDVIRTYQTEKNGPEIEQTFNEVLAEFDNMMRDKDSADYDAIKTACTQLVSECTDYFVEQYLLYGEHARRDIEKKTGETILMMATIVKGEKERKEDEKILGRGISLKVIDLDSVRQKMSTGNFQQVALAFVQAQRGCNGGGGFAETGSNLLSFSPKLGGSEIMNSDKYGSLEFNCPSCKRINKRTRGQLASRCQHCSAAVGCEVSPQPEEQPKRDLPLAA